MREDKVLSFYNLKDEEELEEQMDGMEGLEYEKLSTGADGEAAVYRLYIGDKVDIVRLVNIFTSFIMKNGNSRFRLSKVQKFIVYGWENV